MLNESSSIDEKDASQPYSLPEPTLATELFFFIHILASYTTEKLHRMYDQLSREINKAAKNNNLPQYEEMMGSKLTIDLHFVGKSTLENFRQFLTFSSTLFICMTSNK